MNKSARSRNLFSPRRLGVAAVVIAALAGAWYLWGPRGASAGDGGYRTETVQRGNIRVTISSTGTLSAISTVTVGSQISGQVTDVLVDFNSPVKKGDILARIDPSTYRAQLEQGNASIASARAQLAQAQASLRNASLDFQRKQDLADQKLIARSDFDLARAALDQARAQVSSAQAQIRQQTASVQNTQVNIDRAVITSPVDGVVLTRKIDPGQTVAASFSAPELFTIAEDLSKMQIQLAVDESDIGQIRVGQQVSFTADAFPDRQFKGVVGQVRMAATTTNNVVTYPVIVTVDNSDGTLLPGLTVNAEIEVSSRENVLKLGNAALRFKPGDDSPLAELQPEGASGGPPGAGGGSADMSQDWQALATSLGLNAEQKAAFDQALQEMKQRQAERAAQWQQNNASQQGGGNRLFGGGRGFGRPGGGGGGDPNMMAQMRARMRDRLNQQFTAFVATLSPEQRGKWSAGVDAQLSARRVTVYRSSNGKPEAISIKIGASDGTSTEVSGPNIREGDLIISGERAAAGSK
ncbi:efflux RND transporter periplasmic adaptor subunit [Thermomonas sp.]|uniref:efflux RND transporter periplasmic adaptor subunit n=1 Tax=Thermomonas sp. TaxID=1971895 RepID=UPI001DE2FBF7|nr:efflux RND transporter periplasmic adaptor subunit [Thermomonas sp.]MBZ0086754.1 efflux RND transporter periplasmic adaptor subunit [Thermomonas sp.]MCO5055035.1 efflux RND transporter periplasmic adaptor subunit [Thermomonas sp.]HRO63076.1 efflux RND transporter periplasmic adaptor subunit [Thermomonas sp.]